MPIDPLSVALEEARVRLGAESLRALDSALEEWRADEDVGAALESAAPEVQRALVRVAACSEFVLEACRRDRALLRRLLIDPAALGARSADDFRAEAAALAALDEAEAMPALRRWRRDTLVRIAWRDLAGLAETTATLRELSAFADAVVDAALAIATRGVSARFGTPLSEAGEAQPFVVVGMGKLGGGELNFSSDIDLVFLFPEFGDTDGARPISNEEYFTRLGQALIRLLDAPTAEGFVFRTDMRLRPFGDSGPLATSFSAFEDYLTRQGRAWERYAWVKARALTGAEAYAQAWQQSVRPFVYRRYLDFGVFESLREMKALIEREVERRDLADNVKLGPGGIREIEFVVQALQLVRGGQDRRLQTPSLLRALEIIEAGRMLPPKAVPELREAYLFLRRLENHLQMAGDRQVHAIPADAAARERLALAMDCESWAALERDWSGHRARVEKHFKAVVFGGDQPTAEAALPMALAPMFSEDTGLEAMTEALAKAGLQEPTEAARLLGEFRSNVLERRIDTTSRRRVRALMPLVVADIAAAGGAVASLRRVLNVFESIGSRSVYFALLQESPAARRRLVDLCAHGDFLAAQIAAHPLLLDELIDDRVLDELPDRAALGADMIFRLEQVIDEEPERQVEALRQFQRAAIFRVAVADLTGRLPVMKVSDRLTEIAELIVEKAMELGWRQITTQFGVPMCGEGAARRAVQICAVGYGKLGGLELGYASDLDIVFLHDSETVDHQLFFVRLAQRIVHLLTMHSAAGRLYEVDMRLRPSGKGGMLVTSLAAFADYQRTEAWTWEHQALLHARGVAGAIALRDRFEALRLELLEHAVKREALKKEVRDMRERMRRELSRAKPGEVDLKQDPGGIADIEFLAQYWALRWAEEKPPVAYFPDTIRQLESVASADLVPQATVDVLTHAYRAYRVRTHHRALADAPAIVPDSEFAAERATVAAIWDEAMTD